MKKIALLITVAASLFEGRVVRAVDAPKPFGALPSSAQVEHAALEMYGFCHFTVDTFTDREWGTGGESETIFNPTSFDAKAIVGAMKAAGLKGVILTCKHHDGFCLWPTKTTGHNISNSPFQNGHGDIVRSYADACRAAGLKFGVYVSPWDRNNEGYGKPEYVEQVYHKQIEELTSQYGKLFEIWFDGANGGTGYYAGKVGPVESHDVNKHRSINAAVYYGWPEIEAVLNRTQPGIVAFSDVGPGARWVGNESGYAPDPCRATITYDPHDAWGHISTAKLGPGTLHGEKWVQAEVDVSIRPGWFWHASQNGHVRSPANLMKIYLDSVGHGATMNLNCPPDRRGILHENDVESLKQLGEHLRDTFATNLAAGSSFMLTSVRGGEAAQFGPEKLLDDDPWSAWTTDDDVRTPELSLVLSGEKTFNLIRLREDIRLGLRVEGVAIDAWQDGAWKEIAKAESIGSCHIWRVPKTSTGKVRIRVTKSPVCPALSDFGLYLEPEFATWVPPIGISPTMKRKAP